MKLLLPCCHIAEKKEMKKKKDWKWKAKCLEKSELRSTFPKVEIKASIKKGE
jgi:hypothetical protein